MKPIPISIVLLIIVNIAVGIITLRSGLSHQQEDATASTPTTPMTGSATELQLKRLMLELVNQHRQDANVRPVTLGDNQSAQAHADAALKSCYASHWDQWGLKPQHRYALAGGDQYADENLNGAGHCASPVQTYNPIVDPAAAVKDAVHKLASSPGHLQNMTDPRHRIMHTGIATDRQNAVIVQLFTADYVSWTQTPKIDENNILRLAGNLEHARSETDFNTPLITIEWHPPPSPLSVGQLARTYCTSPDQMAASILPPPPFGWKYTHPETGEPFETWVRHHSQPSQCVNPYDTLAHAPKPSSWEEASRLHQAAKEFSPHETTIQNDAFAIIAQHVNVSAAGRHFEAVADLSPVVNERGAGIYTIVIRATPDQTGQPATVARYTIWLNTKPPAGNPYTAYANRIPK